MDNGDAIVLRGKAKVPETKKDVTPAPAAEKQDNIAKTSIFEKNTADGKNAKVTVIDTNGNGFDNNDTVRIEGDASLFSANDFKNMMPDYKNNDTRTGLKLNEAKLSDDKKIKTEVEKDYSAGSIMNLLSQTGDSTGTSVQNGQNDKNGNGPKIGTDGKLNPGIVNGFVSRASSTAYRMDAIGNLDNNERALKYLFGYNGDGSDGKASGVGTAGNGGFVSPFLDQTKIKGTFDVNNEDDKFNKKYKGGEADRLWDLAKDRSKYKEGTTLPCKEEDIPQGQEKFKTEDGTEYELQGTSQYTTPGTTIRNYKTAYKSADGKIAFVTNDNESNKNKPGADGKFPREFRRGITFFNPASNDKAIDEKVVADPANNKKVQEGVGVHPKKDGQVKMHSLHVKPGESISEIKANLKAAGLSSSIVNKIVKELSTDGAISPGTFSLAISNGDVSVVSK